MIAQGQFTRLLNASTEERSKIFRKLFRLSLAGDVDGLIDYISSFGIYAALISIFMITITDMTGLPSIPFLTVNGAIFGLVPGLIVSWVGEVLGTELSFLILRTGLRRQAIHVISRHHLRNQLDKYSRFSTLAMARSIPYIPNVPFTAIAAVSHLSQKDHFLATAVGKVPRVVIEVLLGHVVPGHHRAAGHRPHGASCSTWRRS